MNVGATIISLRKKNGLSQIELAKACELSQTYLSQIENNRREPQISSLKKISDALGVPLPMLFFMSAEEEDVPVGKRQFFNSLMPAIKAMISEFFPSGIVKA
ncbi:MAG: helix-turn-helix transcriptional regulator [Saprospiraceae bacterium]|nr:helix-turn-helix transcriptional regulator [Saprospiraceae bacterium]